MSILAFDPSKTATGFVFVNGNSIAFDVFSFKKPAGKMTKTAEKMLFQQWYAETIGDIIDITDPNVVASEFSFGSQTSSAAWYLAMTTQAVQSACIHKMHTPPLLAIPQEIRRVVMDKATASKEEVRDYVMPDFERRFPDYYDDFNNLPDYKLEAVCDAYLVFLYAEIVGGA